MFKFPLLLLILVIVGSKDIVFTRHGQRTPTKFNDQKKEKWIGYEAGDLTEVGVNFLIQKGRHLSRLIDIHDQDGNCVGEKMRIVSSPKQRTIMSTFSLIRGLCPYNYKEISQAFVHKYLSIISTNPEDLKYLLNNDYSNIFTLSNYTRSFVIENDVMFHGQDSDECPLVETEFNKIISSDEYRAQERSFKSNRAFPQILEYIKKRNAQDVILNPELYTVEKYPLKKVKAFFGDYKCEWAQGFEVEPLTEEEYHLLTQITTFIFYDVQNGSDEINKASLTAIFDWVKKQILDDGNMHWFSAHDTNQVAILDVIIDRKQRDELGYQALPPFGSDLIVKIHEEKVKVLYNGEPLKTVFCDHGFECHLKEVITFFDNYIVDDVEAFCRI